MKITKLRTSRVLSFLPYLLFFLVSAFYFFWFANYIFFYQEKLSLFRVSSGFLFDHLSQPGGFLEYLGKLVTAFYFHKITGAALLSLILLCVIFILAKTGQVIAGERVFILPFIVGATLLYLQTDYQFAAFNHVGILLQLLFFYSTLRFFRGSKEWIPVALFPLWYFLTGGFAWIFLALFLFRLLAAREKGWWQKVLLIVFLGGTTFYISMEFLFYQTPEQLLLFPVSAQTAGVQPELFVALVIFISILPLLFKLNWRSAAKIKGKKFRWMQLAPFVVILILGVLLPSRIDKKNSHYFHAEELFYKQDYEKLIAFNEAFPSTNRLTIFLNNIALAETGRLNDRLFEFPQSADGSTLFLKWEIVGEVLRRGGYFYYTIGMVNEAQRWAYEYMVMRGYTPEGLKMLIKTELINENYKVAEKYISVLKQSVFYRGKAREFEKLLYNDAAVEAHPELGQKKRIQPKTDFFVLSEEPAANLDSLIRVDSTNVFASEYKFAWLLLQKDVESVTQNLALLENAGYRRIPRHIEEAAVGFKLLQMGEFPELDYLRTSTEMEQRFSRYYQVFQQNSSSKDQARRALHPDFSDTFWYYLFFR